MKKLLSSIIMLLACVTIQAEDVEYTYEGQTLTYTIDRSTMTCKVKEGTQLRPSNIVRGDLIIPEEIVNEQNIYTVTGIGSYALWGSASMSSVDIPKSVTTIGRCAFSDCRGLKMVNIHDLTTWYNISFGDYKANPLYYAHNLALNEELITELVIPETITKIGNSAFAGYSSLISVDIPSSVTTIGEWAFYECEGLTSVNIHDLAAWCSINFEHYLSNPLYYANNLKINGELITELIIPENVTMIGNNAFYGCGSLTSVEIPNSVTTIGNSAFDRCDGLATVDIPESVTTIGDCVFSGCTGLTSVSIPNSITAINYGAFMECASLKTIDIPNSVTYIGSSAFWGCSGLTSIDIPEFLTSIGYCIFRGCSKLKSVNIPESVTAISYGAFDECIELNTICCVNPTPPNAEANSFTNEQYQNATLYVPNKSLETYKAIKPWSNFQNIQSLDSDTGIKNLKTSDSNTQQNDAYYDLNGRKLIEPQKGLNIINGKKVVVK